MRARCVAAALLCLLLLPWLPAEAGGEIHNRKVLVNGVSVFRYTPASVPQPNVVNVLAINPGAEAKLKVVDAPASAPDGKLPTSQLCKLTPRCIAAVNGGFFVGKGIPVFGQEPDKLSELLEPVVKLIPSSLQVLLGTKQQPILGHDSFTLGSHPRTIAFGNGRGKKWFATIDGRQGKYSQGIPLAQSIELAKSLGATWVVNLDGGCSTTMVVMAKVYNRPCHNEGLSFGAAERPVANAIVIVADSPKPKPTAVVQLNGVTGGVPVMGKSEIQAAPPVPAAQPEPVSSNRSLRGFALTLFCLATLLALSQTLRLRNLSTLLRENKRPAGKHSGRSSI